MAQSPQGICYPYRQREIPVVGIDEVPPCPTLLELAHLLSQTYWEGVKRLRELEARNAKKQEKARSAENRAKCRRKGLPPPGKHRCTQCEKNVDRENIRKRRAGGYVCITCAPQLAHLKPPKPEKPRGAKK